MQRLQERHQVKNHDDILRREFIKRALKRHDKGAKKYGDTWRTNKKDWINETLAELEDAVNYLSYLYVRLKRIQNATSKYSTKRTKPTSRKV
jgi:hypothetical protein